MRADTGAEGQTSLLIPHFVDHEDVSLGLEHAVFSTDALHRWVAECHTTSCGPCRQRGTQKINSPTAHGIQLTVFWAF